MPLKQQDCAVEKVRLSRRSMLKAAAAAGVAMAAPTIIPSVVLGKDGGVAPSNRITMAAIGVGSQGTSDIKNFLGFGDCQVVAVCDVDRKKANACHSLINNHYKNNSCRTSGDFREIIARTDIDAVQIATPDHWHAVIAIAAAQSGKDIYGEKPITHDLREGRALSNAVSRHGRIWQTGSWQRSKENFHQAASAVRSGRIGKIHHVEVGLPTGKAGGSLQFTNPPPELDYDFWIGPSPWAPYSPDRTHWNWRWQLDYGGGQMMDWIGHHGDIAHWGLGYEYTGPVEIEGKGEFPTEGLWNAATTYRFNALYKTGVVMTVANAGNGGVREGTKWIGDKGWIWVSRSGIEASDPVLIKERIRPGEVNLYPSTDHYRNFIDCVKSRRLTITPAEVAHRSASIGHLGLIAMIVGRKIHWNPETEEILNDSSASALLGRAKREPWHL